MLLTQRIRHAGEGFEIRPTRYVYELFWDTDLNMLDSIAEKLIGK
jgi:hypothetical protein